MGVSEKELVDWRNRAFLRYVLPVFEELGFGKQPMGNPYWGREPKGGYQYELWRLRDTRDVESMFVHIVRSATGFKLVFNRFKLDFDASTLNDIAEMDDLVFITRPASETQVEFPSPRWLGNLSSPRPYGVPNWRLWFGIGVRESIDSEAQRLARDLQTLDIFIQAWCDEHQTFLIRKDGTVEGQTSS